MKTPPAPQNHSVSRQGHAKRSVVGPGSPLPPALHPGPMQSELGVSSQVREVQIGLVVWVGDLGWGASTGGALGRNLMSPAIGL